jgi:hypothetical protein
VVTLDFRVDVADARALELVNKTNQFNLNGRRYSEAQWRRLLERPGAFLLRVAYEDRFGPLGTIAVAAGHGDAELLRVDAWVMSCRAFSRRTEYQTLRVLFERFGATSIVFDYMKTDRNGPLQEFFAELLGSSPPAGGIRLRGKDFEAACPPLHHVVRKKLEILPRTQIEKLNSCWLGEDCFNSPLVVERRLPPSSLVKTASDRSEPDE